MTPKLDHTKLKRLSKGQRANIRKMKQAARAEGTVFHPIIHRTVITQPEK